jgi:long-chain fatty acid transport protein
MPVTRPIRAARPLLAGASLAALAAAGAAHAAAIEQTVPSTVRLLYQEGTYAEFGLTYTDPDQSGEGAVIPPIPGVTTTPTVLSGDTGDLFKDRWTVSAAWKNDINENWSYLVTFDEPYLADTDYGGGTFLPNPLNFTYEGSLADLRTYQITGVLAYDVNPNIKFYGGARVQRLDAKAAVPFIGGYSVDADIDYGYGYLLGAAYARPEIALRVALTYFSKIEHDLDTAEFTDATGTVDTDTDVDTPQSVSLDVQTGVAEGTLVFGSIRWVDWSEFAIEPPIYGQATAALLGAPRALVDYEDDWWTYQLGIGRQLTDNLAGSLALTYEPDVGGEMTTLGPYDGRNTATAALSYDYGQINVTGGLTYGKLGDTRNLLQTDFDDGSVWGAGLRVGYTF